MKQQPLITIWIVMIYFLFGYIGHIVAIPPGIATPVWPACQATFKNDHLRQIKMTSLV